MTIGLMTKGPPNSWSSWKGNFEARYEGEQEDELGFSTGHVGVENSHTVPSPELPSPLNFTGNIGTTSGTTFNSDGKVRF